MNKCIEDLKVLSDITKSPNYKPAAIREMLKKLDMNEKGFAVLMNVTVDTVRLWTSGVVKPCGTAMPLSSPVGMDFSLAKTERFTSATFFTCWGKRAATISTSFSIASFFECALNAGSIA